MRIEVGMVKLASRLGLAGLGMMGAAFLLSGGSSWGSHIPTPTTAMRFAGAYALTVLAFAAYPRRRRTDLAKAILVGGILLEIARCLLKQDFDPMSVVAEAAGAYAVLLPSFLERFRGLTRADPHELLSFVYPQDRRRKQRHSVHVKSVHATSV